MSDPIEPHVHQFDTPLTDEERAEVAALASHELYLLTKMVPLGTVRAREVNDLYRECIGRAIREGVGV